MQIDMNPLDNVVFSDFGCLEGGRVGKGGERWMDGTRLFLSKHNQHSIHLARPCVEAEFFT